MTICQLYSTPDGDMWEVQSDAFSTSEPCVVVPVSAIARHDNETLGEYIRGAVQDAKLCGALFFADYILQAGVHNLDESIFEEQNRITILHECAHRSEEVRRAIGILESLKRKIGARSGTTIKRAEIANNYDRIFIEIGRRDGFHCQHCRATKSLEIDHVTPLSAGGSNDLGNLQILCKSCNCRKGSR